LLLVEKELGLMPGLLETLKLLKEENYKLAIASSGVKKYIALVLNKFHIKEYFDVVITGDDVKVGKPNPETYLVAARKLGVLPAECLVLEDATKGIQSAKAAGCFCIAVKNPNVPSQTYPDADLVVNSLHDVNLDLMKRLNVLPSITSNE
jgi:HAD superfamily hydrolase (TIGR01509 family)